MKFTLDLSGYKEKVSARLPEGSYTVTIQDIEATKARTGSQGFEMWLVVAEGEYAGATLIDRFYHTDPEGKPSGAIFRIVNLMQAVGLPTPKKRLALDTGLFLGKRVQVEVEDGQPYEGRVKSEITSYFRSSGGAEAADEATDLEDLAAEAEETPAPAATPAPASTPAATPEVDAPEEIDLATLDLG